MNKTAGLCSIVIVNWKSVDYLKKCLDSIRQNTQFKYETIVIDNNSGVDEQLQLQDLTIDHLILNTDNKGFAAANNQGFKVANGEYLMMLNPDTLIIDNALDKLILYLKDNRHINAIAPKLYVSENREYHPSIYTFPTPFGELISFMPLSGLFYGIKKKLFFNADKTQKVDWVMGCAILFESQVIEEIGYLDENYFFYSEEVDFCKRMADAGKSLYYYPDAEIIHYGGKSQEQANFDKEEMLWVSKFKYYEKFYSKFEVAFYFKLLALLLSAKLLVKKNKLLELHLKSIKRKLSGVKFREL